MASTSAAVFTGLLRKWQAATGDLIERRTDGKSPLSTTPGTS
jgi:hypothetical protein